MYRVPRTIKYDVVDRDELEEAMANDLHLVDIVQKKIAAEEKLMLLKEAVKEKKAIHKASFWSLWKAEGDLCKEKIRTLENAQRWRASWQKRVWQLFKILKIQKRSGKKKKD